MPSPLRAIGAPRRLERLPHLPDQRLELGRILFLQDALVDACQLILRPTPCQHDAVSASLSPEPINANSCEPFAVEGAAQVRSSVVLAIG